MNEYQLAMLNITSNGIPCAVSVEQYRQLCGLCNNTSCLLEQNKKNKDKGINIILTELDDSVVIFDEEDMLDIKCTCSLCKKL